MTASRTGDSPTDEQLLATIDDRPLPTEAIAAGSPMSRGHTRARLQALADRGLVVRRGDRTDARWTTTATGREYLAGGQRLVADGGDPEEADEDDRFDPDVEEIPVEIGEDGEWGGPEELDLGKWKLIGGAVLALVVVIAVIVLLRKIRS